ncbi:MAG: outer membrane protein assembly factor BamE [Chromatiaceae bacterium]
MRKLLTRYASFPLALTVLVLGGCGGEEKPDEYQTSMLEDLPFVYKMTVQQGNILTEEMVDGLQLGMTRNQVRYLLGTPLLTDFFHTDRWDYVYTIRRGHEDMQSKKLTLYFQDDALTRIDGTMRPDPTRAAGREPTEILVDVPDYKERKGLIRRSLEVIGVEPKD